ncbi:MAG TPA: UDP-N-acetylglucosamine 2-epimerase (non-hydrolyzing) [Candidatus Angelobacter sp.]|nr:UDP-N-acetylglucosamine 2-epimerase (non-hydrolyzing) [Candidatus Angelobacter sp.]
MATKYLLVFGTRPDAIKMAPLLQAFHHYPQAETVVCVTGQHEELLDSVLSLFRIRPHYNLRVMTPNQQLGALTACLLPQLGAVIIQERPDWVLVQGDTTSAMAAAMAAYYAKVPVAHIEAGIRSQNKLEPFPEEVNRKVIDVIADLHFAPTTLDKQNLIREGISPSTIHVTGNTGIDALRFISALPFSMKGSVLENLPLSSRRIILVTVHRRENHGAPLEAICQAIRIIASRYHDTAHLVLPVHPNPKVTATVSRWLSGVSNITLTPALGYRELIALADACFFAMVDSGGLQEELPCLGKPALVLRNVADRPGATIAGAARLVGVEVDEIVNAFTELMEDPVIYAKMAKPRNLFGNGKAAQRIARILNSCSSEANSAGMTMRAA